MTRKPAAARRHPAARPSRRAGQAGLTLIEMVVAIAVISIGVVGIAYGFSAVVRSAGDTQIQAELDGAAQTAATYVQTEQPYRACATTYRLPTPPSGMTSLVSSVGESRPDDGSAGYPRLATCGVATDPNAPADYGIQEITITVSDGSTAVTRMVWKADQP
jgi:prepilin-type N-terminal cleavage/methylation domain-containing protein